MLGVILNQIFILQVSQRLSNLHSQHADPGHYRYFAGEPDGGPLYMAKLVILLLQVADHQLMLLTLQKNNTVNDTLPLTGKKA